MGPAVSLRQVGQLLMLALGTCTDKQTSYWVWTAGALPEVIPRLN